MAAMVTFYALLVVAALQGGLSRAAECHGKVSVRCAISETSYEMHKI